MVTDVSSTLTPSTSFLLDLDKLHTMAESYAEQYQHNAPFPHIVIDNFLDELLLNQVLDEVLDIEKNEDVWTQNNHLNSIKRSLTNEEHFGSLTRQLLYHMNSSHFIQFLEKLTGIDSLMPDPHFNGGGIHVIERGGFLNIHADFNINKRLRMDRRLNLLLYLNKDWQEDYGGCLELWDADMQACRQKILPVFNRCVIFNTTSNSYHGHPEPLNCPADNRRRSLALYYYSNGRPEEDMGTHETVTISNDVTVLQPTAKPASQSEDKLEKHLQDLTLEEIDTLIRRQQKKKNNAHSTLYMKRYEDLTPEEQQFAQEIICQTGNTTLFLKPVKDLTLADLTVLRALKVKNVPEEVADIKKTSLFSKLFKGK